MITPTVEDLQTISEEVWLSYLDPEGTNPLVPLPVDHPVTQVTASVSVSGTWTGHVVVDCSDKASRLAASALLGIEFGEVTEEDVTDAVGELVNVIGGNVKSLFPDGCLLSLPRVVTGDGLDSKWPHAEEVCRMESQWQGEHFAVSVWMSSTSESAPGV